MKRPVVVKLRFNTNGYTLKLCDAKSGVMYYAKRGPYPRKRVLAERSANT